MKRVFISYSHKDKEWVVDWLLPRLERAGSEVVIDFRDFEVGVPSVVNIENAVKECDATLLVITPNWLESEWTGLESHLLQMNDPMGKKGTIFPLLREKCELPDRLGIFTYADFADENKKNWGVELNKICRRLGASCVVEEPKKVSLSKLPTTDKLLIGREKELRLLSEAWEDAHTHIISFVAWGGVGKTALVNYWLNLMGRKNYCGAERVYGWSFYSQGASEGSQASADEFFHETLEWFGDKDPTAGSAVEKGRRLARLVKQRKTLLVLDGVEPLQYPPGEIPGFEGRFKDAGMKRFLKELSASMNGLCVISTREAVSDLEDRVDFTLKRVNLEHLSNEAGCELLKKRGIKGSDKEISEAVGECAGHALTLTLLGNFLSTVHGGDIRKRDLLPPLAEERSKGYHARKVMQAYEKWLAGTAELNILYIMGLFDRPAPPGAIEALKQAPPIPGITDKLTSISDIDFNYTLNRLQSLNLLSFKSCKSNNPANPGSDTHPLIRQYFGDRLQKENPEGWQAAHLRLYEYYKNLPEKELPDTLEEMEPLFAAVAHGCRAGKYNEAHSDIYDKRIIRGGDYYILHKIGAFGSFLAVQSNFFEIPWSKPASAFPEDKKALILGCSGMALRALGRLREATQPVEACLEMFVKQENWKEAAINASNLSELLLTLGDVNSSVSAARQAVSHADKTGDKREKMMDLTTLADALHQWGRWEEAEQTFRGAEALQKERQPEYPYLYSLQGYRYCDLLLGRGAAAIPEVRKRTEATLGWMQKEPHAPVLTVVFDLLTLGRAWTMQAETENKKHFSTAMKYLDDAVDGLRKASYQEMLVRGLLARAECYRLQKMFQKAWDDLNEAKEIAELGEMKRHLADYYLMAGKTFKDEGKFDSGRKMFLKAQAIIKETQYFRRKEEIEKKKRSLTEGTEDTEV